MALGASPASVQRMFLRQALVFSAVGLAAGVILSMAATRVLQSLLFGVSTMDPLTYLTVTVLLLAAAAAAAYIPALRATRTDPAIVLRGE